MPATEQTRYNIKTLHRIFAAASVLLLLTTVWLIYVDHHRPWKRLQRQARAIDARMAEWRRQQALVDQTRGRQEQIEAQLAALRARPLPDRFLREFVAAVAADASRRGAAVPAEKRIARWSSLAREQTLVELQDVIDQARFREQQAQRRLKMASGHWDVAKGAYAVAIQDDRPPADLAALQRAAVAAQHTVAELDAAWDAAMAHYEDLRDRVREATREERIVQTRREDLLEQQQQLARLITAGDDRLVDWRGPVPRPGRGWLEMPFLDMFNSPLKIRNIWSDGVDLRLGSFGTVHRFDRCTTCHLAVDRLRPGTADQPEYECVAQRRFSILPPDERPAVLTDEHRAELSPVDQVREIFGLQLVPFDLMGTRALALAWVRPGTPGARARVTDLFERERAGSTVVAQLFQTNGVELAGLAGGTGLVAGDVVVAVNDVPADQHADAVDWICRQLIAAAEHHWQGLDAGAAPGPPIRLTVRRGLPQPFASHPRPDLFTGATSPHPMARFGCTTCHAGQGSATQFEWAAHTPDDPQSRTRWHRELGWFDNRDWPDPMLPRRFAESSCLKCHHSVIELGVRHASTEAPAPKLMAGYRLIRKFGCTDCHSINGFTNDGRAIGPDLRTEPNYAAAALQIRGAEGSGYDRLSRQERRWIDDLIVAPERDDVRHKVRDLLAAESLRHQSAGELPVVGGGEGDATSAASRDSADAPRLSAQIVERLRPVLADQPHPGRLRKVGPALRFVASKLDAVFLSDWIYRPRRFRPSTTMPQYFGLTDTWPNPLTDTNSVAKPTTERTSSPARASLTRRWERAEVASMVAFLRARSQRFDYIDPPADVPVPRTDTQRHQQIERGRVLFQQRGCLACHSHRAFPKVERYRSPDSINRAPDLSAVAAKFAPARNPNGRRWLYSWIKQPTRYDARTVMPDMLLAPIESRDESGQGVSRSDPIADIVAFLMSDSDSQWRPAVVAQQLVEQVDQQAVNQLAQMYLRGSYRAVTADRYLQSGIPESQRHAVRGAERELIVTREDARDRPSPPLAQRRLLYVGAKSIARYGCYGCHDIPGFEDTQPIGIALEDWGRKDPAQLAFNHITRYIRDGRTATADGAGTSVGQAGADRDSPAPFYQQQLETRTRTGFVYQKLAAPRSFDYQMMQFKSYLERLRMPQFALDQHQREQIATFILGLVADPPPTDMRYHPSPRMAAQLAGVPVLERFNCQACHILEAERWELAYLPDTFARPSDQPMFSFTTQQVSAQTMAAAQQLDRRGFRHSRLVGLPAIGEDGWPRVLDEEEFPIEGDDDDPYVLDYLIYPFDLWRPALVDGAVFQTGSKPLPVFGDQLERRAAAVGGDLTKYLLPVVVSHERRTNPAAKGTEAWGWLPPPLVGEGNKVRPDWLRDYLRKPQPIRPAVVMRMPDFHLSGREATLLVNYFAARDSADFPYPTDSEDPQVLAAADQLYRNHLQQLQQQGLRDIGNITPGRRLDDALRIVLDNNYCVKCHSIGDYQPVSSARAKAPDLLQVQYRLRRDYVRRWLARPASVLPYTSMQVNFAYDPNAPNEGTTIAQNLYHGTSTEQLDAVLDLILHFDVQLRRRAPIAPLVPKTIAP